MMSSLLRTDEEFISIYNRNFDNVYRLCYVLLKNKSDAEDITQNVFLKLYNGNYAFNDEYHERGWLLLTARNMSLNSIKRFKRYVVDFINIHEVASNDYYDETLELLLRLKDKYKIVLYMHYYMGYKTREIASIMKVKESTVRSNLLRGRDMLKKMMEEDNEKR